MTASNPEAEDREYKSLGHVILTGLCSTNTVFTF